MRVGPILTFRAGEQGIGATENPLWKLTKERGLKGNRA